MIRLIDDMKPEDVAMLQALYSRSAESVEVHLAKVADTGSTSFMSRFFVNYGHKSIADCGSTTLFFEDVSILCAKAIQNSPLYCGQETSTRYLDMSTRRIVDPVGSDLSGEILSKWLTFYREAQEPTRTEVRRRYPRRDGESEQAYEGAVKARTFDILRGFLPAGVTTQLSFHGNLRQIGDHLSFLRCHPLAEVRDKCTEAAAIMAARYPGTAASFYGDLAGVSGVGKASGKLRAWESNTAATYSAFMWPQNEAPWLHSTIENSDIDAYKALIQSRPKGGVLPHFMTDLGQVSMRFDLDYGSWRDIQRQRNGVCRVPVLTTSRGFEPWYLDQLDDFTRSAAERLIANVEPMIAAVAEKDFDRQYYIPLGYRVPTRLTYGLPATVYVLELRSGKFIHPTLRRRIHEMIELFRARHPDVPLHVDMDPDPWDVRRGTQTITERV